MNAVQFPPLHCFFTDLVGGWFSLWILYAKKETVREIKKRRANQQKTESEWRQPLSLKMVTMETVPFFPLLLSVWSCTFLCNSGYKLAPPTPLYSFIEPRSDHLEAEVGFDRIITGNAYKVTVCIQLYLCLVFGWPIQAHFKQAMRFPQPIFVFPLPVVWMRVLVRLWMRLEKNHEGEGGCHLLAALERTIFT